MARYQVDDKVLYIGGEKLGDAGRPMTVKVVLTGIGAYELDSGGTLFWGVGEDALSPDTEADRAASAARVAAAIARAVDRRDWRRAQIEQMTGDLNELESEERFLDPDPADVAERERSSAALLAQAQGIAARC